MIPKLVDRGSQTNSTIKLETHRFPHFLKLWHYHPELELVYIVKSGGVRFVGDSIEKFYEGELLLLGENLPHMFRNDQAYFEEGSNLFAEALVVHFRPDFLGTLLSAIPGLSKPGGLIKRAGRGILFDKKTSEKAALDIKAMTSMKPERQLISFLNLLTDLSETENVKYLSSERFSESFPSNRDKLSTVFDHIYNHFRDGINLEETASLVAMNKAAFCRMFRQRTGQTFTQFVNKIRIEYASRLLMDTDIKVVEACFESGFSNLTHFNRQFRKFTQCTPSEYRALHVL